MAGIYIHVPYCKSRCIYCDFFTQTNLSSRADYVSTLCKEIELRKDYIDKEIVRTIYFGGGTPSLLSLPDLDKILNTIYKSFTIDPNPEITLEANPDDISREYLRNLKFSLFTRLSLGTQSFNEEELIFLNRRHSAQDAIHVVKDAQDAGFENISIDLIYGLPNQSMSIWKKNLETAISLNIQHISAYHLIYEEGTKLFRLLEQGKVAQTEEELSLEMFTTMINELKSAGFEHYEISNFAKDQKYSKHNTSYWLGDKYLGLGPAAHSFDGIDRAFNVASIAKYIDGIAKKTPNIEVEKLSIESQYNDFILTGLRTMWGVNLNLLKDRFGDKLLNYCLSNVKKHIDNHKVIQENNNIKLTKEGIFISDSIMSDLMWI